MKSDLKHGHVSTRAPFQVVLLPVGVSAHTASLGAFRALQILARDDFEARSAAAVLALVREGRYVCEVVPGGGASECVRAAREREMNAEDDSPPTDLRSPNNSRASTLRWPHGL
jgi:hypothetical protein